MNVDRFIHVPVSGGRDWCRIRVAHIEAISEVSDEESIIHLTSGRDIRAEQSAGVTMDDICERELPELEEFPVLLDPDGEDEKLIWVRKSWFRHIDDDAEPLKTQNAPGTGAN